MDYITFAVLHPSARGIRDDNHDNGRGVGELSKDYVTHWRTDTSSSQGQIQNQEKGGAIEKYELRSQSMSFVF